MYLMPHLERYFREISLNFIETQAGGYDLLELQPRDKQLMDEQSLNTSNQKS